MILTSSFLCSILFTLKEIEYQKNYSQLGQIKIHGRIPQWKDIMEEKSFKKLGISRRT